MVARSSALSRPLVVLVVSGALCMPAPQIALAGSRDLGLGIAIGVGAAILGGVLSGGGKQGGGQSKQTRKPSGGKSGGGSNASEADQTLARYDLPSDQTAIFKSVSLKAITTAAGLEKATLGVANMTDHQRNYDAALERFMASFETAKAAAAARRGKESDQSAKTVVVVEDKAAAVTRNGIDRLVAAAYTGSGLAKFERFTDENWTASRLKVHILDRAQRDVGGMVTGPSAGSVRFEDVQEAINRAAEYVYENVFEVSEILGLNRSVERFNQYIHENNLAETQSAGHNIKWSVTEWAGALISTRPSDPADKQASETFAKLQRSLSSGPAGEARPSSGQAAPRGLALRYRALRVAVDCFTLKSRELVPEAGAPTVRKVELENFLVNARRKACFEMIVNAVNDPGFRVPLPQRTEWQIDGTYVAAGYADSSGFSN